MDSTVRNLLSGLRVGEPQQSREISVLPLFHESNGSVPYLTLGEALEQRRVIVTEVSGAGSVPDLKVVNEAEQPVLLLDGEELAGAKQNRVLNTSILLRPKSETVILVSCTERGRWSYTSPAFSESGAILAHKIRSSKLHSVSASLRAGHHYSSD
jgi:hypothetical protein